MLSIERQFVRTERPLYGHLVSLLENAITTGELRRALACSRGVRVANRVHAIGAYGLI